jgi:hypothetical protein
MKTFFFVLCLRFHYRVLERSENIIINFHFNSLGLKLYSDLHTTDSRAPKRPCRRPLEE